MLHWPRKINSRAHRHSPTINKIKNTLPFESDPETDANAIPMEIRYSQYTLLLIPIEFHSVFMKSIECERVNAVSFNHFSFTNRDHLKCCTLWIDDINGRRRRHWVVKVLMDARIYMVSVINEDCWTLWSVGVSCIKLNVENCFFILKLYHKSIRISKASSLCCNGITQQIRSHLVLALLQMNSY